MKRKTLLLIGVTVLGAVLDAVGLLGDFGLPENVNRVLMLVGGLMAIRGGFALRDLLLEKINPVYQKQNHIERTDERNAAIRYRAKAVSGDLLQWVVMAGMGLAILMDAPTWVVLLPVAGVVLKGLTEMYLIGRYQDEM